MAAHICELEVAAPTRNRKLGVMIWAVQSLKGRAAAGEDMANTEEAWARNKLDKMFELWALLEVLNRTVSGERSCVARLVDAELMRVQTEITAALSERKAGSARRYSTCETVFLSRSLLMCMVRPRGLI